MEQDEIYLIDLWRIFCREWRWFVAVLVMVLGLTLAWVATARSQWEATAWIQIGQVGSSPVGQDPKAEPLLRVIARVQSVAFEDDVLRSLGLFPDSPEGRLFRRSLKTDPQPYANLFKLTLRAYSADQAKGLAKATLAALQTIHQRIDALPLKLARDRLDELESNLRVALADRDRLESSTNAADRTAAALSGVLLASKNQDIRALQQARSELLVRLAPNYTYETSMPWPVYVPDTRAFPNHVLALGMGIVFGLFLGGVAAIARNALRRRSTKAHPHGTH
ncbi:MAG TPA: Wzz/FepE/Etk N-terminal domain-containing protein [Luteibacter sp.]|uniref:Wzz/FepE/Etk N-terminal domain-containing protein n=1 Tax=Luteibacter sp. TaxID=1886636 RepID=UPI002B601EC7|nr:Wzz/FepE/Etk N-terminal domain-containing protein [Luteibacter sp.]HVI56754.1 Wzz/FepE/Etk N-terminal domain-containing protein [Luteibacter sp.]